MENDMGIGEEIRKIQEYLNQLQSGNTSISFTELMEVLLQGNNEGSFKYKQAKCYSQPCFHRQKKDRSFGTGSSFRAYRGSVSHAASCI